MRWFCIFMLFMSCGAQASKISHLEDDVRQLTYKVEALERAR